MVATLHALKRARTPGGAKTPRQRRHWPWYFEITEEVKGAKK